MEHKKLNVNSLKKKKLFVQSILQKICTFFREIITYITGNFFITTSHLSTLFYIKVKNQRHITEHFNLKNIYSNNVTSFLWSSQDHYCK